MPRMRRYNAHERWTEPCAASYAALCRSDVHDLRVVTRSYSLSQLSLLKTHETMVLSLDLQNRFISDVFDFQSCRNVVSDSVKARNEYFRIVFGSV